MKVLDMVNIARSAFIVRMLCFLILTSITVSANAQEWDDDCGGVPCGDSPPPPNDSLQPPDSLKIPLDSSTIFYPPHFEHGPVLPESSTGTVDSIHLGGQQTRTYSSLCDVVKCDMRFYSLRQGPNGQRYSISYLGLPAYMLDISPEVPGQYEAMRVPPLGLTDLRLYGLEKTDEILIVPNPAFGGFSKIAGYEQAPNYDVPYTEVSIFRGDYSFSNALIKFRQPASRRLSWGASIGVERSNGYLTGSEKERQNYALDFSYKLLPDWQILFKSAYQNVNDEVIGLGLEQYTTGKRDLTLQDITISAIRQDTTGNRNRIDAYYRSFDDKFRASELISQRYESFYLKGESVREHDSFRLYTKNHLSYRRVRFDSAYHAYTVADFSGGAEFKGIQNLTPFMGGGVLAGYNDDAFISLVGNVKWTPLDPVNLTIGGKLNHIPPTDMARWLPRGRYDFDGNGVIEYIHSGYGDLRPTRAISAYTTISAGSERVGLEIGGLTADLNDLVIWRYYSGTPSVYFSDATDATLYSGTASSFVNPFSTVEIELDYSYSRIKDNEDMDISLMPRHNLFGRLFWEQRINRFNLTVWPSIEFEYHSENYADYLNPYIMDDYALVNIRYSVKLKSFTFYYSMENVFDVEYETLYGYPSERKVVWGFRWMFEN